LEHSTFSLDCELYPDSTTPQLTPRVAMATLNDLPVGLLLNVAHRLATLQASFSSLARIARKYRPIAAEILYASPIVQTRKTL
jgi:hypothetical protein